MRRVLAAAFTILLTTGSASAIEQNLITTVAGGGSRATAGPALTISIFTSSVAADSNGNLYFADRLSNRVFKVEPEGTLSLVGGNGVAGFAGDGGPALDASFNSPGYVALDSAGNLFIADVGNARIRRIDASTGVISTVAGNGTSGFAGDGGPATAASLGYIPGLALDSVGNLFVADYYNQRVRRVDSTSGVITTVAGGVFGSFPTFSGDGGPATNAALNYPSGVTVDSSGNLFIADQSNHRIRRVDASSHVITTVAGNGSGQFWGDFLPATSASLFKPTEVAVDSSGNLFIADQYNHRIRRVDAVSQIITTVAGNGSAGFAGDGSSALNARLSFPAGIAFDAASNLFIWDAGNLRIRRVSAATGIITTVAGNGSRAFAGDGGPATQALLDYPSGLAADGAGNLYIADVSNERIRRVDAGTGIISTVAGNGQFGFGGDGGPATSAQLRLASVTLIGVAVDPEDNFYITDTGNNRIRRVDAATGIITTVAGGGSSFGDGGPATSAKLNQPTGVAVDSAGNLYIADSKNLVVRKVDASNGIITTVAGGGFFLLGDGGPATNAFLSPTSVALDSSGNLLIAEQSLNRIRRVDATTGIITRVAGNGFNSDNGGAFAGDGGPAVEASLSQPIGVAVDSLGDVFIADGANFRIRRVDAASGIITTIAGAGSSGLLGDGIPATSAFLSPVALALDTRGSLFIADLGSNRIRRMGSLPIGASPQISEVSVTKERKHFVCAQEIDLCCADPPFCSCCCIPDEVVTTTVDVDLVTISARVQDADGPDDSLRVNVSFLDPPPSSVSPGNEIRTIALDMFDTGPAPVTVPFIGYPFFTETVLPGDSIAGDGVFTRKLYLRSSTTEFPGTCVVDTDNTNLGGTFTSYYPEHL